MRTRVITGSNLLVKKLFPEKKNIKINIIVKYKTKRSCALLAESKRGLFQKLGSVYKKGHFPSSSYFEKVDLFLVASTKVQYLYIHYTSLYIAELGLNQIV